MLFTIPLRIPELLVKAMVKTAKVHTNLGDWHGQKIIAVGPQGGKIIGYGVGHKPIYAWAGAGAKLATLKQAAQAHHAKKKILEANEQAAHLFDWLNALEINSHIAGDVVSVSPEAGEMLAGHFDVSPTSKESHVWKFQKQALLIHVGKPFTPAEDEEAGWAASVAAGDDNNTTFPDLSKLEKLEAGSFAGSHDNKLFQSPDGRKWVFKGKDPTIARAEEAATRIGRLILGDRIPASKFVTVNGKEGVLIAVIPGKAFNNENHKAGATSTQLKTYEEDIGRHFIVDWLTSNHDGHSGNFLANGDTLNAIDKGQAWRFFGKDELDKDYHPNPSPTIYNKFWNAVQGDAALDDHILKAMAETVSKAETITPDQFRLLIGPYVATAAPHVGFDAGERADAMVARLQNLRADMEKFLSNLVGHKVTLPKSKSEDNFETMPEAKPEPKKAEPQKLVIQNPDKPKFVVGGAKAPVVPTAAPGWPLTKKDTTVHHPGNAPSVGTKWPSGLPGPGCKLTTKYKGKDYMIEMSVADNKPLIIVTYPDGTQANYDTLNKAGDSLYLYNNDMPLTMSATEKKLKGISLGSKAFKLDAFKDELAGAQDNKPSIATMTPAELEKEEVVPKGAVSLSLTEMLMKHPPGLVTDTQFMPIPVHEAMMAAMEQKPGKDYYGAPSPGTVILKHGANGTLPVLFVAKASSASGLPLYSVFHPMESVPGGWDHATKSAGEIHDGWGLDMMADVKATFIQKIPESAEPEPAGPPPEAVIPESATIPKSSPKTVAGVLPVGTEVTVQKKFKMSDGGTQKLSVKLTALPNGKFETKIGDLTPIAHVSLSSACDLIWVVQQGYVDIAAYKAATGKAKIPSGGGWKFWGITPKAEVVDSPSEKLPEPPKAEAEKAPGKANWGWFKDHPDAKPYVHPGNEMDLLTSFAPGDKLIFQLDGMEYTVSRAANSSGLVWISSGSELEGTVSGMAKNTPLSALKLLEMLSADGVKVTKVKATPTPELSDTVNAKVGTEYHFGPAVWVKQDTGEFGGAWELYQNALGKAKKGDQVVNSATMQQWVDQNSDKGEPVVVHPQGTTAPFHIPAAASPASDEIWDAEAHEDKFPFWGDMTPSKPLKLVNINQSTYENFLTYAPTGVSVMVEEFGKPAIYQKGTDGSWYMGDDGGLGSGWLAKQTGKYMPTIWKQAVSAPYASNAWYDITGVSGMVTLKDLPISTSFLTAAPLGATILARNENNGVMLLRRVQKDGDLGWETDDKAFFSDDSAQSVLDNLQHFSMSTVSIQNPLSSVAAEKPASDVFATVEEMSAEGMLDKMAAFPVGGELHAKDKQGPVIWEKTGEGEWSVTFTMGDGGTDTKGGNSSYFVISSMKEDALSTGVMPKAVLKGKAKAPKKSPTVSKLGHAKFIFDPSEVGGETANKYVNQAKVALDKWIEENPDSAKKPSGWDSWVPPPGVVLHGTHEGKDYYLVETGMGHTSESKPGEKVSFAIISASGVQQGHMMKSATAALKNAAKGTGLPEDVKALKKVFGLDKAVFAPGETAQSLKDGTGPSALPYAEDVLDEKPLEEMTPAEKMQPVKKEVPLLTALKLHATLGSQLTIKPVKGKPSLTNICLGKGSFAFPAAALKALALEYGFLDDIINVGGVPKTNSWGGAFMTLPTEILEGKHVTVETTALEAEGVTPEVELPKPKKKAHIPQPPDPAKEALKAKAKALGEWAAQHTEVDAIESLHVLSHFQAHVQKENSAIGLWARKTDGGILLGAEHADFPALMHGLKLDEHPVETPLGTFYEVTTAQLADATPGQPALGTITGPDGKEYPKGTTFQTKQIEHSVQELMAQEPGFYKFKEHKEDPKQIVLKFSGNGDEQLEALKAALQKYGIKASGAVKGSGSSLAFMQKSEVEKVWKTDTVVEPDIPPQPPAFTPAPIPFISVGSAMWSELKSNPSAEFSAIPGMKLLPFGKVVLMGKPGIFRDFQVSVRRVRAADGKIYHEVSGQLAGFDATASKLHSGTVYMPTGATKVVGSNRTLNYNEEGGYTDESGENAGNILTESGFTGSTDGGSSIEIHGDHTPTYKDFFRVRIPEGKDIEAELGDAFSRMGFDPADALAHLDSHSETVWKKWSIVRTLLGPKGWAKALNEGAGVHKEAWLNKQLKALGGEHLVAGATIHQTFEGHATVTLNDGEKFKKAGWEFCSRYDKNLDSLFFQLSQGVGWASRKTRQLMGSFSPGGQSGPQDTHNGGATGAFFSLGSGSVGSTSYRCVAHPRVFERTDWWRYPGDNYGNISGQGNGSLSDGLARYENNDSTYGEIMFEAGVSLADIMCVTVPDEDDKQKLMKKLEKAGVEQVNGVPLQDFILVGGHAIMSRVHPSMKI